MKELLLLIEKVKKDVEKGPSPDTFQKIIRRTADFYAAQLNVSEEEIAIFFTNDEKTILSFAFPDYLVDSGMIPVSSTDAIAAQVFRTGRSTMENNFQQQKHLFIFEMIRTPDNKIKPIWKVIAAPILTQDEKLGVIEISRRGTDISEVGADFTLKDLDFLEKSIQQIAPFFKSVMPANFRGKLK